MSYFNEVKIEYGDNFSIDSFGRLRTSYPYTIFDSKQLHDKQPLFWSESSGSSATSVHSSTNARTRMSVTADSGDFVIRQTKQRFNYQPGKSQLVFMTFRAPTGTGITSRVGAFNGSGINNLTPDNGIFFQSGETISWNIAKNGTITETVQQSSWNLDTLDGNGKSGLTLDLDSPQILIMDYEWLGVGRVRVGFVIGGIIYYVHQFLHSNKASFPSVYMSTPNLPLRYEIRSDGTNTGVLDHICSTVISEGGAEDTGIVRSISNGSTHIDANTSGTSYALLGIRLKSTHLDIVNLLEWVNVHTITQTSFHWQLYFNPVIAGTFTYNDLSDSSLQVAYGSTANTVTTPGVLVDSGYGGSTNWTGGGMPRKITTSLRLGSTIDGTRDTLVLTATPFQGSSDLLGSLTVRELL